MQKKHDYPKSKSDDFKAAPKSKPGAVAKAQAYDNKKDMEITKKYGVKVK